MRIPLNFQKFWMNPSPKRFNEKSGADRATLWVLPGCFVVALFDFVPGMWPAVIVFCAVLRAFLLRLDQGLPLAQVAALLAALQWLVGPLWYYLGDYSIDEMGMAVPAKEYFSIAVPGTAAFCVGLLILGNVVNQREILQPVSRYNFFLIGLVLNGIALIGDLAGRVGPENLKFAFFLVSQLRYVGVLYLWFSPQIGARWLALLCVLPLFVSSAESAMFHDMLIWCGLLFCYWVASRRRTVFTKTVIMAGAILIAFTIQGVKRGYREKVWNSQEASLTEEVLNFWKNFQELDRATVMENAMIRINQGWIVSKVFQHVPAKEPYAHGDTVKEAIIAAAVPRFVYNDKAIAGGRVNFMRFTGLPINEQTSMNISLLGEAYANFGRVGGYLFLLIAGMGIAKSIDYTLQYTRRYPVFLFWIPLIFYQAIKAETDSTEILNQIAKGGMLAFVCFWAIERYFPTRYRMKNARKARHASILKGQDEIGAIQLEPQRK